VDDDVNGQTPIDENESRGLLLRVRTQEALNRAEEENIVRARLWSARSRAVRRDLLNDSTLRRIHKEMFGGGVEVGGHLSPERQECRCPMAPDTRSRAAIVRELGSAEYSKERRPRPFSRRLSPSVRQHSSLRKWQRSSCAILSDRLVENFGGVAFPWGRDDLQATGQARDQYLAALRAADAGDLQPLIEFSRSGA